MAAYPIFMSFAATPAMAEAIGQVCEEEEIDRSEACRRLIRYGLYVRKLKRSHTGAVIGLSDIPPTAVE